MPYTAVYGVVGVLISSSLLCRARANNQRSLIVMSTSSVGSGSNSRRRSQPSRSFCKCGDPVGKWVAWTPNNPGRRFIGCPNFQDPSIDCKFFDWVDPRLPNKWYVDLMHDLHDTGGYENLFGEFTEERDVVEGVQAMEQQKSGIVTWKAACLVCLILIVVLLFK